MTNLCFQTKAYWNFLLKSKTKYRIHSPFVYRLVTQCLENPSGFKKLSATDQMFQLKNYLLKSNSRESQVIEGLILESMDDFQVINDFIQNSSEGSFLLIKKPHDNQTKEKLWKRLKTSHQLNVSIDLFFVGILFKRPQQVEEHFRIRLL